MALKLTANYKGIELVDAYHRIDAIRYDNGGRLYVRVNYYVSADAAENNEVVDGVDIECDMTEKGITKASLNIKKVYDNVVKSDERFAVAEDI